MVRWALTGDPKGIPPYPSPSLQRQANSIALHESVVLPPLIGALPGANIALWEIISGADEEEVDLI